MTTAVVVTAAGMGTRLGFNMPKALVPLAGRSLIEHALDGVAASGIADRVVVTIPPGTDDILAGLVGPEVTLVAGGSTRQISVKAGLDAVPDADIVLVHDAARCLTPPSVMIRVRDAVAAGHAGAVPAIPVTDTIKEVVPGGPYEPVVDTLERGVLRAVQTPQGFRGDILRDAHRVEWPTEEGAPDDASLVEHLGHSVVLVEGSHMAVKITTVLDLKLAELLLEEQERVHLRDAGLTGERR